MTYRVVHTDTGSVIREANSQAQAALLAKTLRECTGGSFHVEAA